MADGTPRFFSVGLVSTGKLTDDQFTEMITQYASRSERGLFKECFRDADPDGPLFWRTFGHDYSEAEVEDRIHWLRWFAEEYFKYRAPAGLTFDDCVKIETHYG